MILFNFYIFISFPHMRNNIKLANQDLFQKYTIFFSLILPFTPNKLLSNIFNFFISGKRMITTRLFQQSYSWYFHLVFNVGSPSNILSITAKLNFFIVQTVTWPENKKKKAQSEFLRKRVERKKWLKERKGNNSWDF